MTVWLDAARGCLPMRQRYFGGGETDAAVMEFTVGEAIEASPGVWVPVSGTKGVTYPPGAPPGSPWVFEHVMTMDRRPDGTPAVAVNSGVRDDFFNLADRLPPGTRVGDIDFGQIWTVSGSDLSALAETMAPAFDRLPLAKRERALAATGDVAATQASSSMPLRLVGQSPPGWWDMPSLILALALALALGAGVVMCRAKWANACRTRQSGAQVE
jgi:hypothetical protein